jgi:biotin carboxyl carrier protein
MRYEVEVNGRLRQVNVHRLDGHYAIGVDDKTWLVDVARVDPQTLSLVTLPGATRSPETGGMSHTVVLTPDTSGGTLTAQVDGVAVVVAFNGRRRRAAHIEGGDRSGPQRLLAPMPGKVVRLLVKPGDTVRARQPIVVIEAMKMENELRSTRDGRIAELAVRDGQSVEAGVLLAVISDS